MTKFVRERRFFVCILMMAAFFLIITGCSSMRWKKSSAKKPASQKKERSASPLYYDFGDVLVPSELKVDKRLSFVFRTPSLSTGVLSFKGRVEVNSLIAFFDNNMTKDNWRLVSSFKSLRSIMLFHKENRWCVINISEKEFTTYVEIWVSPAADEAAIGLLK